MTEDQLTDLLSHRRAIDAALAFEQIIPVSYDNRYEGDRCDDCPCIPDVLYFNERTQSRTCLSCVIDKLKEE